MSKIQKLAIRGIRSFGCQNLSVIEFYSPLTVIVGHNGSGKTTIIECLKYITTGDLPPNTKGGAFVHDPSMAGEATVMAEVLLRFENAAGTKLVASRRLQVTKKKTAGLTMKTLEGTLSYNEGGGQGRRTISTKCAEMDSEVPRHLGISKAILENVIFCHQEDSNWPLSEPATLKKKFDEIFEATKYTKALDNIKSIKKDAAIELKVDKEKYNALTVDKARAKKLQASINKLMSSITIKEDEQSKLDDKICELVESNKAFYEGAARHKEILNKHSTLLAQKEDKTQIVKDLLEDAEEIKDATDAELVQRRDESRTNLASHAQRLAQAKSSLAAVEVHLGKLRRRHQQKFTELGQLKAQTQRHWTALEERQEMVVSLSSLHNIAGFESGPFENGRVADFSSMLGDHQKRSKAELENLKREGKRAEEAAQREIFKIKSDEGSNRNKKQNITERIADLRPKMRNLDHQIGSIRVSEADIKSQSDTLAEKRESLLTLQKTITEAKADEAIKDKQHEMKDLEARRDELHAELSRLNRQSDTRAKLALKRADVKKKQDGIQTLIAAHGAKFQALVQVEMKPKAADHDIGDAIRSTERRLVNAEAISASASKEVQTIDTKLQMNKSKLSAAKRELESLESMIRSQTDGQTVAEKINEAETEIQLLVKELETIRFSLQFYDKLIATGKNAKQCTVCQRGFNHDDELKAFERQCKIMIDRIPKDQDEFETDLKGWTEHLEGMKELLPGEMTATKLRETDIPKLQQDVNELQSKSGAANRRLEEARAEVEELKDKLSELQLCKRSAVDMARMSSEIEDLIREVDELERELQTSGTMKTIDDVQDELEVVSVDLIELRSKVDALIDEREGKRTAKQRLEAQIHQAELDLNKKRQQMNERIAFEGQKEGFKNEIAGLDDQLKKLDEVLKTFSGPLRIAEDKLQKIRDDYAIKEAEMVDKLQLYNKSLNQLDTINREIEKFVRLGTEAHMNRCQEEIIGLEGQIKSATEEVTESQQALTDLDKESARAKAFERNINDNIRLRAYRQEIAQLEEDLAELDIEGAEMANRKFEEEYHKARKYEANLQAHQAKLGGEIGMDKENLKDKQAEMAAEFKNILDRHRTQLVKVKTIEIANQDLDKYAKALDQAIMKYHSHKMAEINDTIQTLWQKTYQGSDIDKILIKSENENAKTNRSYNYRVVMMKDQVEMDMRGRCSAGQKVLASIIIRLALAESFGTNCGILALDEPTTNLDKDNISALATALSEIIKERKGQANFQLVVITHDEDFLNQLGQSDVLDKYWRVCRNTQQQSIIERQRLV